MVISKFEERCWKDIITPELLEIYKPYVRQLRVGKRPAMLAIDLYNGVFKPGPLPVIEAVKQNPKSCGEHAWNAIEPGRRLFELCRGKGIPMFHTTRDLRRGRVDIHSTNRPASKDPSDDFAFFPDFAPLDGETVIFKERASAFFGTPLIAYLTRLGVDSIIVCGESTSGCVRASVVDGYSYGFHMVIVEEAVFDRSLLSHKINLFDLHHKYADVMPLEELTEHLNPGNG